MANHASHAALPYPIRGARFTLLIPFLDADGDPTDPTTPDFEVSKDDGAPADAAETEATVPRNGVVMHTLSSTEMDCSCLSIAAKAASGPKTSLVTIYPRTLASIGTGTLSAGSAGGGTLGTILPYDLTGVFVRTTGGTGGAAGALQARQIATYNTGTGAFTVVPNWETALDATTTYELHLPTGVTLGMLKALNPATAGRTVVVDAAGLVDATTVKVGPTGAATAQTAGDIPARLPAALVGGRMDSNIGAVVDGVLTAAKFAAGAFDAVWSVAARVLTAGTNIVLAKGTGLTGLNDLSAAQVNAEADTALVDAGVTPTVMGRLDVAVSSRMATFAYTTPLDAAGVRAAVGLASANLDTQFAALPASVTASMDATSTGLAAIYARAGLILAATDVPTSTRLAAADYTSPPSAAAIRAEMDANSTDLNAILAAIAALNNLSSAGAEAAAGAAMESRGFTSGRGPLLDALDAAISSRAATGAAMALTAGERTTLRDAIWKSADYLETGKTPFDALRYIAAAILGVYVPGDTSTFAAFGNAGTPRISAATPTAGGRTSVSLV